jgi:hypothetical protein
MRLALVLATTCTLLAACGGDDGGDGEPADLDVIAATPASGTIAGTPFTLGTRFMNQTDGELWFDLLPTAAADCTLDETDGQYPFIIFFTPAAVGRYPLGQTQFVTFVPAPSTNLGISRGVIEIEELTATTVRGGLHVWSASDGEINGRFDGPLCFSN